jgi:hypothetical protein
MNGIFYSFCYLSSSVWSSKSSAATSLCQYTRHRQSCTSRNISLELPDFYLSSYSYTSIYTLILSDTVATNLTLLWSRIIGPLLLKRCYSGSLVATDRRYSSDECANIICPLLLEFTVTTGLLTSTHLLLVDRKHNLYLIYKRRHDLKQNTIWW